MAYGLQPRKNVSDDIISISDYFYFQKASKCISNKCVIDVHFILKLSFTKHPLPVPLQTRKTRLVNYFLFWGVGFGFCPYSCIPLMHINIQHKTSQNLSNCNQM